MPETIVCSRVVSIFRYLERSIPMGKKSGKESLFLLWQTELKLIVCRSTSKLWNEYDFSGNVCCVCRLTGFICRAIILLCCQSQIICRKFADIFRKMTRHPAISGLIKKASASEYSDLCHREDMTELIEKKQI